jgi:hypothetical protein
MTYNNKEAALGVRRYILKHYININKVLINIKLSRCIIAGGKSQFCQLITVIIGYLCGIYNRSPKNTKVIKILK